MSTRKRTEGPGPWGHFCASEKDFYVWGSRPGTAFVFHPLHEYWSEEEFTGEKLIRGVFNGACVFTDHFIYQYGGTDEMHKYFGGDLYWLDRDAWKQLKKSAVADGPMKKEGCKMIVYDGKIFLFGGYGVPSSEVPQSDEFKKDEDDKEFKDNRGWTNELHSFDPDGKWSKLAVSGEKPPPCSDFTLTMIDDHRAVMFGGNRSWRTNDVYILDLKELKWEKLTHVGEAPCPGRSHHATVCLDYGEKHPRLLVTGGVGMHGKIHNDAWIMEIRESTLRWTQLKDITGSTGATGGAGSMGATTEVTATAAGSTSATGTAGVVATAKPFTRYGHSAAASSLGPGLTEVTFYGGSSEWPADYKSGVVTIPTTAVMRLELIDAEWKLVDLADGPQLGTEERVAKKVESLARKLSKSEKQIQEVKDDLDSKVKTLEGERQKLEDELGKAKDDKISAEEAKLEAETAKGVAEDNENEADRGRSIAEAAMVEAESAKRKVEDDKSKLERDLREERRHKYRVEPSLYFDFDCCKHQ